MQRDLGYMVEHTLKNYHVLHKNRRNLYTLNQLHPLFFVEAKKKKKKKKKKIKKK